MGSPRPPGKRTRRPPHIALIFVSTLALMLLMLTAINWRHWLNDTPPLPVAAPADTLSAHFALCEGPVRTTCVVDGDTIWFQGAKIRIADINAPEVTDARCNYELDLGRRATQRLIVLLNAGSFSLVSPEARDADRYDRKLRNVMRGGRSLGDVLVQEGLAEAWTGHRRNWCEGRGRRKTDARAIALALPLVSSLRTGFSQSAQLAAPQAIKPTHSALVLKASGG
jgi:endonuclease YncB( thermonuclease family)